MKRIGLLVLVVALVGVALGSPADAACPAAGSIAVSTLSGLVGQVWLRNGSSFSVSPVTDGASIWFATQDGKAETILILINQSDGSLMPHVAILDLNGQELVASDVTIAASHTFTLSVAGAIADFCQ
jgi:hypothetical protein